MSDPAIARRPWWLGIAVVAIGATWTWGALKLDISDRLSGLGPGAFVLIVGIALMVLGVILLFQIHRGEKFEAADSEDALAELPASVPALLMVGAAVLLPAFLMDPFGFPLTAAISYTLVTRSLGAKNLLFSFVIGAILSSVCWYAFSKLGVQLGGFVPKGF